MKTKIWTTYPGTERAERSEASEVPPSDTQRQKTKIWTTYPGTERAERSEASEVPPLDTQRQKTKIWTTYPGTERAERSEASEVPPFRQSPISHTDMSIECETLSVRALCWDNFRFYYKIRISWCFSPGSKIWCFLTSDSDSLWKTVYMVKSLTNMTKIQSN